MLVLIVMAIGIFIGIKIFPIKYKRINEILQMGCTALLIFCMGLSLGKRENFLEELSTLGIQSIILAVIPICFSVIVVYLLTKRWKLSGKEEKKS